jgi:hypothetical protein
MSVVAEGVRRRAKTLQRNPNQMAKSFSMTQEKNNKRTGEKYQDQRERTFLIRPNYPENSQSNAYHSIRVGKAI